MHVSSSTGFQKTWTSLWSCSWGFCGLQILHIQDQNQIGSVPFQKHILALHTSATSAAGVSAGVSAFTYRHKHGAVNNLWIICHFQPTNFTCIPSICTAKYTLKARWFVFALESLEEPEEQNMTTFTIVVLSCLKKFPGAPCTCCFANAFSSDILGVKVQKYDKVRIPLATKTYLQSSCWSSIFELDGSLFPALVLLQATKLLQTPWHVHPCLHPSWTCSHEPPQLVFRPSPINRLIFTQTHQTVKGRNHFALSSRTMHACQLFDSCRFPKKHEPASGVAAGVSAAYRFCIPKITIKSDLYPSRNIFWPYTLQPPRRQEFQPASQLSPIVTNTVPWIICESFVTSSQQILLASLLYAQPNTPWKHVDLFLH